MASRFLFLAFICIPLVISHPNLANGQQAKEKIHDVETLASELIKTQLVVGQPMIQFEIDGRISKHWVISVNNALDGHLPFYENGQTILELELTSKQELKYKRIVNDWKKESKKLFESFQGNMVQGGDRKKAKEVYDLFQKLPEKKIQELKGVLNSRQKKRIHQLIIRFLVRSQGLDTFFMNKAVKNFLNLDKTTVRKYRIWSETHNDELLAKLRELYQTSIESAFGSLSKDQKKVLAEKWPCLNGKGFPQIDRLRIQCQFFNEYQSLKRMEDDFEKVDQFPSYNLDVAGGLKPDDKEKKFAPTSRTIRRLKILSKSFQLDELRVLELNLQQRRQVATLLEAFERSQKKSVAYSVPYSKENMKIRIAEAKAAFQKRLDTVNLIEKELNSILVKGQRKRLHDVARQALAAKYGPAYDLLHGPLGEKFQLSKTQKASLKRDFQKTYKSISKKSIEIEEFWIQKSIEALGEKRRKKMQKIFGTPLLESPPILILSISRISELRFQFHPNFQKINRQ